MASLLEAAASNITNATFSSSSSSFSDEPSEDNKKAWVGFLGCLVCVIGFGSSYIPVKKYVTGDGFYYQMFLALGVWFVGLIVNIVQGFPHMEGLILFGGAIWCLGNFLAVYTVQLLGMALGIPLYNVFLLIVGWSTGTFGLGIKKNKVSVPELNYVGLVVAIISVILYIFVNSAQPSGDDDKDKSDVSLEEYPEKSSTPSDAKGGSDGDNDDDDVQIVEVSRTPSIEPGRSPEPIYPGSSDDEGTRRKTDEELYNEEKSMHSPISDFIEGLSSTKKKVWGVIIAVITGVCFSVNFIPAQHMIDYDDNCSKDQLDYIFVHFTGFLLMALIAFLVYSIAMRNRPIVYPRLGVPAFISGLLIGLAQVGWYVGNKNLSFNVTFPINTSGPSVVASLWGILAFKEIRGFKQLTLVTIAIVVSVVGVILITLSKVL